MKNVILLLTLISLSSYAVNEQHDHHMHSQSEHSDMQNSHQRHSHEGHLHEMTVNGDSLEVNPDRFDKFTKDLSDCKIAVVSVTGMVCDFCARGIEKTFKKDNSVLKIDVDLGQGKVVIAYEKSTEIDFDKIKNKILINGQNATKIQVLEI